MCTRFSFDVSREKMKRQFNLNSKLELQKSYNIGPTHNAYILTNKSLELQVFRWGLIPHWAQEPEVGANLINAMAEGIETKLSFRLPVRQRRCIVFADSYYVWQGKGLNTQPYRVMLSDNTIMAFAGVWDVWLDAENNIYKTFAIITSPANKELMELGQTRMPVNLLTGADMARWMSEVSLHTVLKLLKPMPEGLLNFYPVSKDLDNLENNYIDLHKPIELEEEEKEI